MDEQIFEDLDDGDESINIRNEGNSTALNNYLSNGSVAEVNVNKSEAYKQIPVARTSQISKLKGLQIKTNQQSLVGIGADNYTTTTAAISKGRGEFTTKTLRPHSSMIS